MANPEHLKILKRGVKTWNKWRHDNTNVTPDLMRAILPSSDLFGAVLTGSDLTDANFARAVLSQANLTGAKLLGVDLTDTDLSHANFTGVDLTDANLKRAVLTRVDLTGANLTRADLTQAILIGTDLTQAILTRAVLTGTILAGTNLTRASLAESSVRATIFGNIDLSTAMNLESIRHQEPSTIGTDTLAQTLRSSGGKFTDEQIVFFEGAGVPSILLEYLPSILESNPLQFYSCFISYSTGDEEFADKLNGDLKGQGISTWKWDIDAVPGRYMRDNIDMAIRNYDKLILVCSANSLASGQVQTEIRRALQKEQQIKKAHEERVKEALESGQAPPNVDANVLVPIRIDDSVFEWDSPLAADITEYYIPDFTDAEPGSAKYKQELQRLIDALNPKAWPPSPGPSFGS